MYVRKEAVLSSQIEGTQSSLQDLLAAEAQMFDQNLPRDVDEVVKYVSTFLLTERGVLHKPVLYLSRYFKQHRQSYYEHLQTVRTRGAWEAWLAFFLRGVVEVAGEAADTARRVLQLREQHRRAITDQLGRAAGNGHKVLESLFDRPIVAVNDVQKTTGTTYVAANSLVSRLVELGVLSEMTGNARNRRFRFTPYIALFSDPAPDGEESA
jgi:Fic family protein